MAVEHISLYRKWRPRSFEEVVGQSHVTQTLANALATGRLVHAYLFCGPRGTGKTSTARILAKAINCEQGPTARPCNECEACRSIAAGNALDVIEIDAASNRKIDEIRDLLEKIPYAPTALRSKVYIVDEVHQLTPEASSALLKTLEEPPAHVVFVLATTEPHKILPTIVSRCQRFDFSLVPTQEISELLSSIAASEGIRLEGEAVAMIAEHAHGSVRDAIGVMDQISNLSGETVTQKQVAGLLGDVESDMLFEVVDLLADRDTAGALALVGRVVESGKDPRRFVESLIAQLRNLFLIQNAANPPEIVEATVEHFERLVEQSRKLKRYEVVRLIERLGQTHRDMRWSENPRLLLEVAMVRSTSLDVDVTLEGLAFRLEELERKIERLAGGLPALAREAASDDEGPSRDTPVVRAGTSPAGSDAKAARPGRRARGRAPSTGPSVTGRAPDPARNSPGTGVAPVGEPAELKRAREAWKAVLGEFKNQGKIRLYALLTKARVVGSLEGEVVLSIPGDAEFHREVLEGTGGIQAVEEVLGRFLERPATIRIEGVDSGRDDRGAARSGGRSPDGALTGDRKVERGRDGEERGGGVDSGKVDGRRIAKLIKDSFEGEIVE